jgi:hypothetical protein
MTPELFMLALACGAVLIAVWWEVRFARQRTLVATMIHAAAGWCVVGVLPDLLKAGMAHGRIGAMAMLLGAVLPGLVYAFCGCLRVLRLAAGGAGALR